MAVHFAVWPSAKPVVTQNYGADRVTLEVQLHLNPAEFDHLAEHHVV